MKLTRRPTWRSVSRRAGGAAAVAWGVLLLAAWSTGSADATPVRAVRIPCSAAQYASPTPLPGYRTVLGVVGLPRATRTSTLTRYVIGGGNAFQRRFPYAVSQTLLVTAGEAPTTLMVPNAWTGREVLAADVRIPSRSSQAFTSLHFDACPRLAALHPHLGYSFTILVPRSGCYPLNVQAGTQQARVSLNLSLELTRNCRPR
jgi:hypothetical protein